MKRGGTKPGAAGHDVRIRDYGDCGADCKDVPSIDRIDRVACLGADTMLGMDGMREGATKDIATRLARREARRSHSDARERSAFLDFVVMRPPLAERARREEVLLS